MCGICGIINFNNKPVEEKSIRTMMQIMKHRGPDDDGVLINGSVGFGFVRLSILDLSPLGHQPMFDESNRYMIIHNGEVYNYIEIRDELKCKGYQFKSNTDTEVILYSYIEWGEECLNKFNGMWAFIIYDLKCNIIFSSRDRFGMKPFYYHLSDEQLIIASEITPILNMLDSKPTANDKVILNFLLTNRTAYSEETFFNEIIMLQPGNLLLIKPDEFKVNIKRWYDAKEKINSLRNITKEEYYETLKNAIELQLRSDVPIGICLSGGLDSSSIASVIAKEFGNINLNGYSAVYDFEDRSNEYKYIKEFSSENINLHFTKPTAEDFLNNLDEYISTYPDPHSGTSTYAEFCVMKLAKSHSTVVLNGQGADEVLGGYDYFYGAYLKQLLLTFQLKTFFQEIFALYEGDFFKQSIYYMIFFLLPFNIKRNLLIRKNKIINKIFYNKFKLNSFKVITTLYKFNSLKEYFLNHLLYKFQHHLLWADQSGMHFSIESRFPFIDHNLIELSLNCNSNQVLYRGWTKYILRESLKNVLPKKIRNRKIKIGFETPQAVWFCQENIKLLIKDILSSSSFRNRKYFNQKYVTKILKSHLNGKKNHSEELWKLIHLELWLRKYID